MKSNINDVKRCINRINELFNANEDDNVLEILTDVNDTEDIGKLFKRIRVFFKYNQEQMSELIGISTSYLSRIENSTFTPSPKILNDFVKVIESSIQKKTFKEPKDEMLSDYKSKKLTDIIQTLINKDGTIIFNEKPKSKNMRVGGNPSTALKFEIIEDMGNNKEEPLKDETGKNISFYDPNDAASYILKGEKYIILSINYETSPIIVKIQSLETYFKDYNFWKRIPIDNIDNYKICFNRVEETDHESLKTFLNDNYYKFVEKKTWKTRLPEFCIKGLQRGIYQGYILSLRPKEEKNNNKNSFIISYIDIKPIRLDGFAEIGIAVTDHDFINYGLMSCMMNYLFLRHFFNPFFSGTWTTNKAMLNTFEKNHFIPYFFKEGEELSSCFVDERKDIPKKKCYSVYLQRPSTFDLCDFLKK